MNEVNQLFPSPQRLSQILNDADKVIRDHQTQEAVDHPTHYNSLPAVCDKCGDSIECIEVVRHKDFNIGNAMKYLWRAGLKGDVIEDLEKAIWYIRDEIGQIKRERESRK